MKKIIITCAALISAASGVAHAQATPEHAFSFNAGVVTDYRYRGISQSRLDPALQGGADYTHNPTGFYLGTWASTIKWIDDAGGDANVEIDVYGGKRGEFGGGVSYDVGVLAYVYPGHDLAVSPNTTEVYGQVGYGPAYLKYSHSVTNLFGFADSEGSGYIDLGANFDITDGYVLGVHVGHQRVENNSAASYTDWKVGVTKDFGIVTGSLAVIGTDADGYLSPAGKDLGKTGVVLTVGKTF